MNDLPPEAAEKWQRVEAVARDVLASYGYREIRFPLVEKTELYRRSIGEVTDIVEKEMYTFEDRNGESLTLRPEGTAGCVRAGIENGLFHNQTPRLWYMGPMFRHERPQKGRYRQFHQIGVEAYGLAGPDVDAELILMNARLWRALGIEGLGLQINSLGTVASRARYREALVGYLRTHSEALDDDSRRRLETNPLRVLDSKNPAMQPVIAQAPRLTDHLDDAARAHFETLTAYLRAAGVEFTINPRLVRGLEYYCLTVFEWASDAPGSQGTVSAGGRYDHLVEQLGGRPTPAAGFALGMERLIELAGAASPQRPLCDVFVATFSDDMRGAALAVADALRDGGLRVLAHCGPGNLKAQLRRADQSGARFAVIVGLEGAERAGLKDLASQTQETVALPRLAEAIRARINSS